ncbi:MAG: N-acetylmuramoyl-L-alanine amidase [Ignavibacteriales bacterium]|nr:MAG: hypothetical protein F9K26_10835 [Ignavibacteriaceae bacterium]MBW7874061.1 N-acetylmuramoyl-L-alanine amidase [Ignavibacteria bacterium]MCZ2143161.1 N-acetylmuramoyl-L-alanine amidase [Ignavibacteriales bacterium]OQY74031.1 MAG: hypothetical protein B6D45_07495 [Ignavibacteriales bacterium UTCHB3]MBV6444041.1 hypothetical protein [Ignavibacteriaceae bacterium]
MKRIVKHINEGEFLRGVYPKQQIVLHGTGSSTAANVGDWWNIQKGAIATAFAVDKGGELIELFPPCYWAYHTGNGSTYDTRNIGIEIANEGYLKEANGKYYWDASGKWVDYRGEVFDNGKLWRGFRYFAAFTEAQYDTVAEICAEMCRNFDIKPAVLEGFDYSVSYLSYKGIVKHCNVYPSKMDVTPAFDMTKFRKLFEQEVKQ